MKLFIFSVLFILNTSSFAHEGHGEMPTEAAKYGGVLGNVIDEAKMEKKGKSNSPLMKAEILLSEDGTVRLYLYDLKMNQIKAGGFSTEAKGIVDNSKAKTKKPFMLQLHNDHYIGKILKQKKRPFDIYI